MVHPGAHVEVDHVPEVMRRLGAQVTRSYEGCGGCRIGLSGGVQSRTFSPTHHCERGLAYQPGRQPSQIGQLH